jgi:hypothetical protein
VMATCSSESSWLPICSSFSAAAAAAAAVRPQSRLVVLPVLKAVVWL